MKIKSMCMAELLRWGIRSAVPGAILTVKLMYHMRKEALRYGLETLCIGGGQGLTVIYERV